MSQTENPEAVPPGTPFLEAPDVFVKDFLVVQRLTEDESQPAARFNFFKAHFKCMREIQFDLDLPPTRDGR